VLTLWRTRLRGSERPERIFAAVRAVVEQTGILKGRQRRALDSTLLDDAVATQDTVTQLVAAIRRVRRLVPAAATLTPAAHDYDHDPGKPACAWDDPQARDRLVSALVSDALAVLPAVAGAELDAAQAEAVGLLALVAGQDVEPGEQDGTWRIARKVPPDRVISVVDSEARHMPKSRSVYRDGYKAHLATEPETGLITAVALTPANTPDGPVGIGLLAKEPPGLEVLGDSAYGGGQVRIALRAAGHHQTIKPIGSHASIPGGFTKGRLHHRPPGAHRDLPSPTDRGDQSLRGGQVRAPLPLLPAALPLHHRQPWPHGAGLPVGSRAPGRPPPGHRPHLPGQLPALAADGGTLDRLAGRWRQPAGPVPRRGPQSAVAVPPSRGHQPAPAGHPRRDP
jgi:hypothetical protein